MLHALLLDTTNGSGWQHDGVVKVAPFVYMHCLSASPCPWKNRKDRKKSKMKIKTRLMTTALVVDSPTPLAPPVVVKPQPQLTCSRGSRLRAVTAMQQTKGIQHVC